MESTWGCVRALVSFWFLGGFLFFLLVEPLKVSGKARKQDFQGGREGVREKRSVNIIADG